MPAVTYVHPDGTTTTVDAAPGASVMETAIAAGVDGIVAECGGNMMCATCHVYADEAWSDRLAPRDPVEEELLDETAEPRAETSRLSCQIVLDDALDGLVVRLPETQS